MTPFQTNGVRCLNTWWIFMNEIVSDMGDFTPPIVGWRNFFIRDCDYFLIVLVLWTTRNWCCGWYIRLRHPYLENSGHFLSKYISFITIQLILTKRTRGSKRTLSRTGSKNERSPCVISPFQMNVSSSILKIWLRNFHSIMIITNIFNPINFIIKY